MWSSQTNRGESCESDSNEVATSEQVISISALKHWGLPVHHRDPVKGAGVGGEGVSGKVFLRKPALLRDVWVGESQAERTGETPLPSESCGVSGTYGFRRKAGGGRVRLAGPLIPSALGSHRRVKLGYDDYMITLA